MKWLKQITSQLKFYGFSGKQFSFELNLRFPGVGVIGVDTHGPDILLVDEYYSWASSQWIHQSHLCFKPTGKRRMSVLRPVRGVHESVLHNDGFDTWRWAGIYRPSWSPNTTAFPYIIKSHYTKRRKDSQCSRFKPGDGGKMNDKNSHLFCYVWLSNT